MKINNVTISAQIVMNLHNLNNEGTEGNHLATRMVTIVDQEGKLVSVNAVSGDMLKHMVADHLYESIKTQNQPLCEGCKMRNANRIGIDGKFLESAAKKKDEAKDSDVLSLLLTTCAMDDMLGNLITSGGRSLARKSVLETGWLIGIPESTRTDNYFHVKFVPEGRGKGSDDKANVGQNIFYRPANSGIYSLIINMDLNRIGYNDILCEYVVDVADRKKRAWALLDAVSCAFVKPTGAMRNTQLPHISGMQGVVAWSENGFPAPSFSPLNPTFMDQVEQITKALNHQTADAVQSKRFEELAQSISILNMIKESI